MVVEFNRIHDLSPNTYKCLFRIFQIHNQQHSHSSITNKMYMICIKIDSEYAEKERKIQEKSEIKHFFIIMIL